jgi:hypothetical protein
MAVYELPSRLDHRVTEGHAGGIKIVVSSETIPDGQIVAKVSRVHL